MNDERNSQRDTEALILEAAEKEFLEKGYLGAKTTSIAEAAGVTHAMFHYYFRTKDKLFDKIVSDKLEKISEIMLGVIGNPELPLKERIEQGVERHFDFLRANPLLPRFIFNEIHLHPERIDKFKAGIASLAASTISAVQNEINNLAHEGKCRMVDARMLMLDIVSLNIFPFLSGEILNAMFGSLFESSDTFLEMRKKENVKTILDKLNIV